MSLVDSIIGAESGGNPNAQNPNSSAGGLGQFIDSTWLAMLKQERPDLVEGRSPQELLALKSDPALSRQMTEAYAAQNGQILSKAGFEANPGNTYLAHFAGPQGAVKVLSADPGAPVEAILGPQAVAANPFLKGMTAADLQGWAAKKMAGTKTALISPEALGPDISGQVFPGGRLDPQRRLPQNPQVIGSLYPAAQPIFNNSSDVFPGGRLDPARSLPPIAPPNVPQQQETASLWSQMPAEQVAQPQPIFTAPRKAVDLSKLRAALQASGARPIFGKS